MSFLASLRAILYHKDTHQLSQSLDQKVIRVAQSWALCLMLSVCIGVVISYFIPDLSTTSHLVGEFLKHTDPKIAFFLIALVGPIMEELLFRSFLIPNRWTLSVFLAIISASIYSSLLYVTPSLSTHWSWFVLGQKIVVIGVFVLLRSWLLLTTYGKLLVDWLDKRRYGLLSISSILFGLVHITNFADSSLRYMILLLTLPQLIIGCVLGAIRIQGSLRQSIAVHCSYNAVLVLPLVIILGSGIPMDSTINMMEHITDSQGYILMGLAVGMLIVIGLVISINVYTLVERYRERSMIRSDRFL